MELVARGVREDDAAPEHAQLEGALLEEARLELGLERVGDLECRCNKSYL